MSIRELDGRTVQFGTTGYTNNFVFVLYDRDTDSIWHPLSDGTFDAVAGPRKGASVPFVAKPGGWRVAGRHAHAPLPRRGRQKSGSNR